MGLGYLEAAEHVGIQGLFVDQADHLFLGLGRSGCHKAQVALGGQSVFWGRGRGGCLGSVPLDFNIVRDWIFESLP